MTHPDHDPDVGDVQQIPWTEDLALRAACAVDLPREQQLERLIVADMSPQAIKALVTAGWTELDRGH